MTAGFPVPCTLGQRAEEYRQSQDVYESRVAGYNKGGLIVRFGRLRGFVPASQISPEREHRSKGQTPDERWSEMLNEPITVKVPPQTLWQSD